MPCQTICLLSLIIAQALHDDAFEAGFKSLDDLLTQPKLGETDCLDLQWKEDKMQHEIFPLPYEKYWGLWNTVWRTAGNRNSIRPYSLRVGAGSALDGERTYLSSDYLLQNCN